ncbi:hypothetical protein [Phormidesmis priestleyi]
MPLFLVCRVPVIEGGKLMVCQTQSDRGGESRGAIEVSQDEAVTFHKFYGLTD